MVLKLNSFVRFLEEIDDPENHFEINWPLTITIKIISPFYADCAMCVDALTTAGLGCALSIPPFNAACITDALLENIECVECIADFDFSDLGWAGERTEYRISLINVLP